MIDSQATSALGTHPYFLTSHPPAELPREELNLGQGFGPSCNTVSPGN